MDKASAYLSKSWDSIARRYVEHDTTTQETFGPYVDAAGVDIPSGHANDNLRTVADATQRKGDWMQTFSGFQFWPLDPRAEEIHIVDIAHALSMQCRYAGHCRKFYSVAEHSVHLARLVSPVNAMWALLHDASEAYLVDVPRPVKPFLTGYKAAEAKVMAAVCERFGLPPEMPVEVHKADGAIIGDERANMAPCVAPWYSTGGPLGIRLQYWTPAEAEAEFLAAFWELQKMGVAA
ncbi:hypothetical protein LB559_09380 [Mesorhizobium sp. BR1-1-3]|uniref:hypothetical protein n=1 Tax=Mesorhizobium sp. BR1-1-3 TaxID=2876651 RepID=UPI001CD17DBE|nr:hypothetical protein [Mesorhizobium sp. BR1-1-3]MBZ9888150.1 hypothetical protein [Mesorhizobium sp. BR1-1-3]